MSSSTPRSAIVVAGGAPVDPSLSTRLRDVEYVIAADAGLHSAERLGLSVDLLVGDLDSVDLAAVDDADLAIERHPPDKDRTDLVLALDRAATLDVERLTVVSGGGGRLDHALGNLLALASPAYADLRVDAWIGDARVTVIRGERALWASPGATVSLFAVGGPATGVTTTGLRYALDGAVLEPLSSLGVSNEFVDAAASVAVADGVLLAIQPAEEDGR